MTNAKENFKKFIAKRGEIILILIFLAALSFLSYRLFVLFNGPADEKTQAKVRMQTQSANINFDIKTINKIKELKDYNRNLEGPIQGKNPFVTY